MPEEKKSTAGAEGEGELDGGADLTPEQIEQLAKDKALAKENAKTRLRLRDTEKRLADLAAERDALLKEREDGSATDRELQSEAATLKREIADLRKENKERKEREAALEEKTRKKTIASHLSTLVSKLNDPASAVELLERRASLDADDTVVFKVKDPDTGEMVSKEATVDIIESHKLLPEIYFPAKGASGSGGRGGDTRITVGKKGHTTVDLERAKDDLTYYKEHREEILAARRAQRS